MLHCNVHSLDRLASTATKALKEEDTEAHVNSSCFGKGSAAINLIHGLSKMRYKDGVGSPSTFKCFLKDESVPRGLFVRYVGNTLHVLFHLAGVIFLRDKLLEYLKKSCPVSNGLRGSLITDLSNTEICMQLQVLGLFGKRLTGPWMSLFYQEDEGPSNLELNSEMRQAVSTLQEYQVSPSLLFTSMTDVFQHEVTGGDLVFQSLLQQKPGGHFE